MKPPSNTITRRTDVDRNPPDQVSQQYVEQDHRGVKARDASHARIQVVCGGPRTLTGIELMQHDQETAAGGRGGRRGPHGSRTVFYSLAALMGLLPRWNKIYSKL